MALIQKSEFKTYVDFSDNIPSKKLDYNINDAQIFDLKPLVPADFYTDLFSLSARPELTVLLDDYVKPYLICSAFSRYLLWTGRNISQFGIRTNNEDTSTEVSDKARAELIADINNKKSYYWSIFKKKIYDDNYTYDGTTYDFTNDCDVSRPKRNFNIRAV